MYEIYLIIYYVYFITCIYMFDIYYMYRNIYVGVSVSGNGSQPWLAVDLSSSINIHKVYIYQEIQQS